MTAEREGEFWPTRIAMLAELAHADALAIVLRPRGEAFVTYAAHNLGPDLAWTAAAPAGLLATALGGAPGDGAVSLPLLDGRIGVAMRAVPVAWREHRIGALAALRVDGPFSEDQSVNLDRLASLVALELVEENTFWRIQRAAADLEARTKASTELQEIVRAERDPETLLERATSGLARVFAADGVSIMLVDNGVLSVKSSIGLPEDAKRDRKRLGEGISGFVAKTGQPLLLRGPVSGDERFSGSDPSVGDALVAPLRNGDHIIGVVSVKRRESTDHYDAADLDALSAIGVDIAATLSFVGAVARAEEDRKQAIALYELSRLGTLGGEPQQELETAVAMLADVMHHDIVGLWVLGADGSAARRAFRGYDADAPALIPAAASAGPFGDALAQQRPVRADRDAADAESPVWAAPAAAHYVFAPVSAQGKTIGILVLGRGAEPYTEAEADFAATAAEYLFELVRSTDAASVEEQATAGERKRIAQELHDGLAQELTGVVLSLEGAQRSFERNPQLLGQQLAKATRDARATLADVRQYMGALRQSDAGGLSLPTTVARLIDDLKRQTGLEVEMQERGSEHELERDLQRAVLRIIGEALRNVARHAGAKHATVTLGYNDTDVAVTVTDDGAGFDMQTMAATAEANGHFGLVGMRERAEAVGGRLVVRSAAGQGTTVEATIPYEQSRATVGALRAELLAANDRVPGARPGILARLFGR
ncbi:MAG: GAF domain-containing sensor histidine kinase [Chloroflexota bacterium]|nr:GAF domain-containing sensor histidine kinase [Chloroflexota bacterium]